jgi:ParB/RepB/Spo0J family partition protein
MEKMTNDLVEVKLSFLDPHPDNPRLVRRDDVIDAIVTAIRERGFDQAHALIVRPVGDRLQIISGHNRFLAAQAAGLSTVPVWVREMDDSTAYMELVRSNAQSELTALERGLHALRSGVDVKAYAESVGRARKTVSDEVLAAKVSEAVADIRHDLSGVFSQLVAVHAAARWLWPALVAKLVAEGLTVETTRRAVADLKDASEPPAWTDAPAIAAAIVGGAMKRSEIDAMAGAVDKTIAALKGGEVGSYDYVKKLETSLADQKPSRLADVMAICNAIRDRQEREISELRRKEANKQKTKQDREARIASMRSNVSLESWKDLDTETRAMLLNLDDVSITSGFNKQDNAAIEWAQWSWNPVTGCLHDCPYCYARDIANEAKMAKSYPNGFEPSFRPVSLSAPRSMKVPDKAAVDARYRQVFTCSMADLFGRWVPAEWINAVLDSVRTNPQWTFLFLTKFPKRMSEFDIPGNTWMGTTVDLQARVKNAEKAFASVNAGTRWLSVEPLLEPLRFSRLDLFKWIVIGGASSSRQTPEWKPPFEWIADLVRQARDAGTKVYFKTNLLGNRILELPNDAPIVSDPIEAPAIFHYLGKGRSEAEAA